MAQTIDRVVEILKREMTPRRIIVFGSTAREDAGPDSDLNILLVLDRVDSRIGEMRRASALLAPLKVPIDVLVYSEAELEEWRSVTNHVITRRSSKAAWSMTPLDLARVFLSKARQDVEALKVLSRSDVADEIVGFHAQQAIEKALKAVLTAHDVRVGRNHDLAYLLSLFPGGIEVPDWLNGTTALAPYAVIAR